MYMYIYIYIYTYIICIWEGGCLSGTANLPAKIIPSWHLTRNTLHNTI